MTEWHCSHSTAVGCLGRNAHQGEHGRENHNDYLEQDTLMVSTVPGVDHGLVDGGLAAEAGLPCAVDLRNSFRGEQMVELIGVAAADYQYQHGDLKGDELHTRSHVADGAAAQEGDGLAM